MVQMDTNWRCTECGKFFDNVDDIEDFTCKCNGKIERIPICFVGNVKKLTYSGNDLRESLTLAFEKLDNYFGEYKFKIVTTHKKEIMVVFIQYSFLYADESSMLFLFDIENGFMTCSENNEYDSFIGDFFHRYLHDFGIHMLNFTDEYPMVMELLSNKANAVIMKKCEVTCTCYQSKEDRCRGQNNDKKIKEIFIEHYFTSINDVVMIGFDVYNRHKLMYYICVPDKTIIDNGIIISLAWEIVRLFL